MHLCIPPALLCKAELPFSEAVSVPWSFAEFAAFVSSVKSWGLPQLCLGVHYLGVSQPLCHSQVYKMVIWVKYFALYLHCQKGQI